MRGAERERGVVARRAGAADEGQDMKLYSGRRYPEGCRVIVMEGGEGRLLALRRDLRDHSPTGFEWGYHGSGPAQLALALLADAVGDEFAQDAYQDFKRIVVASLAGTSWTMSEAEIKAWADAWRGTR